jgi:hypothetical protein
MTLTETASWWRRAPLVRPGGRGPCHVPRPPQHRRHSPDHVHRRVHRELLRRHGVPRQGKTYEGGTCFSATTRGQGVQRREACRSSPESSKCCTGKSCWRTSSSSTTAAVAADKEEGHVHDLWLQRLGACRGPGCDEGRQDAPGVIHLLPLLEKWFIVIFRIHYWCRLVTVADTNNGGLTTWYQ